MRVPRWLARMRHPSAPAEMSFFDHLDELRSVLLSCLGTLLVLTIGAWFASRFVLDFLVVHTVGQAQFIRPLEGFMTRMKISFLMAFIVGLPFVAFQVWSFVVPGLLRQERRMVLPLVLWSTFLFLMGVAFSALALSPTMLKILMSFGSDVIVPTLTIGYLLDFFIKMALACGILFQLPLVIAVLSYAGLVTPAYLKAKWRHAIVLILIVAAVVTPGDGPSQLVLALPIILLYFASIWVSAMICRRKGSKEDPEPPSPPASDAPPPPAPGAGEEEPQSGETAEEEPEPPPAAPARGEEAGSPPAAGEPQESGLQQPGAEEPRPAGPLKPPDGDWSI